MRDIEVDGYRVEAGSMVLVGIYGMHSDPALWTHPLVFDPDRFSREAPKAVTVGHIFRSVAAHDRASAITSRRWRRHSR